MKSYLHWEYYVEVSQLPQSLHQYTNETNASVIYCQLMSSVGEIITLHYYDIIDYGTGKQFHLYCAEWVKFF